MAWYDAFIPGLGGLTGQADATTSLFAPFIGSNMVNAQNQAENLAYQKDLQKKLFKYADKQMAREDNAVQRRKADLLAAGMNPVLAAGQGASASVGAPQGIGTQPVEHKDPGASLAQVVPMIGGIVNLAQGLAQTDNIRADTAIKNTEAQWRDALLSGRAGQMSAVSEKARADANLTRQDAGLLGDAGLPSRGGNQFFALIKQLLNSKDIVPEVKELLMAVFGDLKGLLPSLPSLPGFSSDTSPEAKAAVEKFLNQDRSSPGAF